MAVHRLDRVYPPTEPADLLRWQDAGWRRERRAVKRDFQYRQGIMGRIAARARWRLKPAVDAAAAAYARQMAEVGRETLALD